MGAPVPEEQELRGTLLRLMARSPRARAELEERQGNGE